MDVLGCLLSVVVHAANIHDTKGGISTAKRTYERLPSIRKFCADAGYRGTFVSDLKEQLDLDVDISEKIKPHQWEKRKRQTFPPQENSKPGFHLA